MSRKNVRQLQFIDSEKNASDHDHDHSVLPPYATQLLLLEAYDQNDYDKIRRLLHTVDPTCPIKDGKTLLDIATADNNEEVLQILSELKINFNQKSGQLSPFQRAVMNQNVGTVKRLADLGADPDQKFPNGESALHKACTFNRTKMLEMLLSTDVQADIKVFDQHNNSVLERACLEDSIRHAKIIIPHCDNALLNHRGYEGKTALHIAAMNQNRALVKTLLDAGSKMDILADNKKSALDIIMSMESGAIINDLAEYYTSSVGKDMKPCSFPEMTNNPNFVSFLSFLRTVDNEPTTCRVKLDSKINSDEGKSLLKKLIQDEKIDVIEFKEVVLQLLKTEVFHQLGAPENSELLIKVAFNVARYVLFREDIDMLEKLATCGTVWYNISCLLESKWDQLVLHTPEKGMSGMIPLLQRIGFDGHKVNKERLCAYYGKHCSLYDMASTLHPDCNPEVFYLKHPMYSLPVWCIITGRFKLIEPLLKSIQFDVLPLSLFTAAIVRSYTAHSEAILNDDFLQSVASKCEKFAIESVDRSFGVDTSYSKEVTVNYLLTELPSYGNASCIEIAAKNGSAKFLQSNAGQMALDKLWYGFLVHLDPFVRELMVVLGVTPFCLLIPALLKYWDKKKRIEELLHEDDDEEGGHKETSEFCNFLGEKEIDDGGDNAAETDNLLSDKDRPNGKKSGKKKQSDELQEQLSEMTDKKVIVTVEHGGGACHEYLDCLQEFYNTPAIKFRYYTSVHLLLVLILSYILLLDLEFTIDWREITIYLIILGFAWEESREIKHHFKINNISLYFSDKWNLIDLTAVLCASLGFCCRLTRIHSSMDATFTGETLEKQLNFTSEEEAESYYKLYSIMHSNFEDEMWFVARMFLAISCMLYWVRLLYVSTISAVLGPKLKMIGEMIVKDLMPFLIILFIFIFGFGVLIHGMLFPNGWKAWNRDQMTNWEVFTQMFKICFYSMVGDYSLDTIMGSDECDEVLYHQKMNQGSCPHNYGRYLVPYVIMPMYVIVTEILLLNLIIALFSKTIDEVDSQSTSLWQFERYELISSYKGRSALPPPFNIILMIMKGFKKLYQWKVGALKKIRMVNQPLTLQFLLFQAIGLRQNRCKMLEDEEDTENMERAKLIQDIRKAVKNDMLDMLAKQTQNAAVESGKEDPEEVTKESSAMVAK